MPMIPVGLTPRLWRVESDGSGDFDSLTAALLKCRDSDTVSLGAGIYSPGTTGEVFPLFVPPGVLLQGQGEKSIIDGDDWGRLSNRPLNPYESLILLGDRASLQNMTIRNSGGNAVSHLQGADFYIGNCQISDNGQHGILLYGPGKVKIISNRFRNNGRKKYEPPAPPIPVPCMQGHHIYFEGMASTRNRVSIKSNNMLETFADGVALAPVFDDPADVEYEVVLDGNIIDSCGRNGLTVSASYGTDRAVARVTVVNNVIKNCGNSAVSATAIFPLVPRPLCDAALDLRVSNNVFEGAEYGMNIVSSFSPAEHGVCNVVINHNQIRQCSKNGVFMATAVGDYHWPVRNNQLTARIFQNEVASCQGIDMEFFAFQQTHGEEVDGSQMILSLVGNSSDKNQIVLYGSQSGANVIELQPGYQEHTREPLSLPLSSIPESVKVDATSHDHKVSAGNALPGARQSANEAREKD